ncbi:pyridoxal 5'-phosphate synthase [Streptomyces sp. NPDC050560]|uniref:pyridoxal 5'-phosphate synthase n=1 Tax=Streptomyces sp. NPDC050560 TaxID=3365630 RepID=UPI0037ADA3DC
MSDEPTGGPADDTPDLGALLRSLRVWDVPELPGFDPDTAPEAPLPLFTRWLAAAARAGEPEPHTMTLATSDAAGTADARVVMLHGADERGFHFATHTTSRKGRQLQEHPAAALCFYWRRQARQVRVRGPVVPLPAQEAQDDLHARSPGALAAALVARQSEPLPSRDALTGALTAAFGQAEDDPTAPAPTWRGYALDPREAEFFQGDAHRAHVRLRYAREGQGWRRELLWP